MTVFKKSLLQGYIAPLLLAVGTAIPLFYQVAVLSIQQPDNIQTFFSLSAGLNSYQQLYTAWKTRLFSNALAWQVDRLSILIMHSVNIRYMNKPEPFAVALWTFLWFLLIALVYILFLKQRSVFYIFGTYAAITFGYMPKVAETRIYPWDMPALFIFTLFLFLFLNDKYKWLLAFLPLAMGFKETAGVLCIVFLLTDQLPKRDKWRMFIVAVVLCAFVKLGIDIYTQSSSPLFTMATGWGGKFSDIFFVQNLVGMTLFSTFFINAGTLLSFLIIPAPEKKIVSLKIIALLFAVGNFLFGLILEYRIWFELIPFALYAIASISYPDPVRADEPRQRSNENAIAEDPDSRPR
ncbi:MAG TPA: hypothetical protein VLX61_13490 [Anaerolineales bacterium]|nr:hypothetical protein [Anaerolineales bacterium]